MRNDSVTPEKRTSNETLPDCNESVTKRELDKKEIRIDQNRKDSLVDSEPSQPELELQPQQAAESSHNSHPTKPGEEQSQAKPKRASMHTAIATTLLGELSAARMRINSKNRVFPPTPAHLREIERCLRDGLTVEQLRNVILVWEQLVQVGKQRPEHFDSLTPFRAANVAKYTEMSLEDARRPWAQAGQLKSPATAIATTLLGELSAARMRINPNITAICFLADVAKQPEWFCVTCAKMALKKVK